MMLPGSPLAALLAAFLPQRTIRLQAACAHHLRPHGRRYRGMSAPQLPATRRRSVDADAYQRRCGDGELAGLPETSTCERRRGAATCASIPCPSLPHVGFHLSAVRGPRRRRQDRARPRPGGRRRGSGAARSARRRASLARKSSSLGWLFGTRARESEPIKGLYIFGDVGRGKTMLMDLFFEASPVVRKRRAHFHEFMADVHERVHALRQKAKPARSTARIRSGSPPPRSRRRPGCSASTSSTSPTSPTP